VLSPDDPRERHRPDLPPLPREKPHGYRAGWQIEERLLGLGVVVLGVVGLWVAYAVFSGILPAGLPPPEQPKGVLVQVPLFNATQCLIPIMSLGSLALIVVGIRRFLDP
jgi:hypothetical protein